MPTTKWRFHIEDLPASIVVFLVALPLCMGVALASGVPPALGLLTGIVGGIVTGALSGAPLQVSGPAAGLTVLVWDLVEKFGLQALGVAVLVSGLLQLLSGLLHLGRWFRAVSPAVIQGMLAGIGVLIAASQFHVMFDAKPVGSGLENLREVPATVAKVFSADADQAHRLAALTGVAAILALVAWNRFRPKSLKMIPGALVAVLVAVALTHALGAPIQLIDVPESLTSSLNTPALSTANLLLEPAFVAAVLGIAVIASAETLLCTTAVDRMHHGERSNYDRELCAQGIGNTICGLLGALPMTGVIVRSSANVEAGAKSRMSAIWHGIWLLALVGTAPFILEVIPQAGLAAILVHVGAKLINVGNIAELWRKQRSEALILLTTTVTIALTDLLTGVAVGVLLSVAKLAWSLSRLRVEHKAVTDGEIELWMGGSATFLNLPKLADTLDHIPPQGTVRVHVGDMVHFDNAALDTLRAWEAKYRDRGGTVVMDWQSIDHRSGELAIQKSA